MNNYAMKNYYLTLLALLTITATQAQNSSYNSPCSYVEISKRHQNDNPNAALEMQAFIGNTIFGGIR